jgi:hypothetical protein
MLYPDFFLYEFFMFPKLNMSLKGSNYESPEEILGNMKILKGLLKNEFQQCSNDELCIKRYFERLTIKKQVQLSI